MSQYQYSPLLCGNCFSLLHASKTDALSSFSRRYRFIFSQSQYTAKKRIAMSDTGVTVKKTQDFSEWYVQIVLKAELADYAPVKGCMIIRPDAYAVWEKIQEIVNQKIKATDHRNAYFPMFIPEAFLKSEAEHFAGFTPEVAWITQGGDTPLEEKLAVRPTSETIMYSMYAKWIRSWRDLPLKINQWCNIVRWKPSHKLFLRTREFLWQKATQPTPQQKTQKLSALGLKHVQRRSRELLAIPVVLARRVTARNSQAQTTPQR
jgi:prolyl-tRNA synthetase